MKLRHSLLFLFLLLFFIPASIYAQYFAATFDRQFRMEDIRSIILEGFENNDRNWKVSASRFTYEDFPKIKFGIEGASMALKGAFTEGETKYVMGVRTAFTRKGYNRVWIYPEEELVIPGRAKKIDVWVWGANYYYNLEVHIRDYTGVVHKLPLGSLHFMGWRNLSVEIPSSIPQYVRYLPMEKPLSFVRFVIWTEPSERVDDFMIYFDHLKVLTDVYREWFDGEVLVEESRNIWSSQ